MSRRRFIGLVGGAAGVGLASWSLVDGRNRAAPSPAVVGELASLPPVESVRLPAADTGRGAITTMPPQALPAADHAVGVFCRDAWGARPVAGELSAHVPVRLTVHHTAAVPGAAALAPSVVREHQSFHQLGRGWPDLAYHYVIDAAGVVYEGRQASAVGDTATGYDPAGHLLVACEGNFDRHDVPDAQLASLIDLLAWAADHHSIEPDTISGHRDWAPTACPGGSLYDMVTTGSLRDAVVARRDRGPVGRDMRCGPEAAGLVAAIEARANGEVSRIPWDDQNVE